MCLLITILRQSIISHLPALDCFPYGPGPWNLCSALPSRTQVTKDCPNYIQTAKHAPAMKEYLICHSQQEAILGCDSKWDDEIFDTIAWQALGKKFYTGSSLQLANSWIQLSKYMNNILPTYKPLITKLMGAVLIVNTYGRTLITSYND